MRLNMPYGWSIHLVDMVPGSENHVLSYVSKNWFPPCFLNNTMSGRYTGAHQADLARLPLLYEHGGIWLDVSILLFRDVEAIWNRLKDPYEFAAYVLPFGAGEGQHSHSYLENWAMAARPQCLFVRKWHEIFKTYWEDRQTSQDIDTHSLFSHLNIDGYQDPNYLAQHVSFQRLRLLIDLDDGFNGPMWWRSKIFMLDGHEHG